MRPIRRTHFEAHRGQAKGANQRKHQVLRETLVQRTFRKLAEKPGARRCRCSTHRPQVLHQAEAITALHVDLQAPAARVGMGADQQVRQAQEAI